MDIHNVNQSSKLIINVKHDHNNYQIHLMVLKRINYRSILNKMQIFPSKGINILHYKYQEAIVLHEGLLITI